jgi:DNA-binding MarR family transcriptional regulator
MPYKPTGRPNGRPPKLPYDIDEIVLKDLTERMDPSTKLVLPQIATIARKVGASRSSIKRVIKDLRDAGALELVYQKKDARAKLLTIYYRIK